MKLNPLAKPMLDIFDFSSLPPPPHPAINHEKLNLLLNYFPLISQISNRIFFIPCLHFLAASRTNKLIPLRPITEMIWNTKSGQ